jgi:hypothetical protein
MTFVPFREFSESLSSDLLSRVACVAKVVPVVRRVVATTLRRIDERRIEVVEFVATFEQTTFSEGQNQPCYILI